MLTPLHRRLRRFLCATCALLALSVKAAGPEPDTVVPLKEIVGDRTAEMWTARWWTWAASMRGADSPVADLDGSRCGAGQEGEVFFLAGTYGSRPVDRTCTVPSGKYLFFPVVTYIVMPGDGVGECAALRWKARRMTDDPVTLFAELDGKSLPSLPARRVAPETCFNVNARSGGPRVDSASNGYWIMLRPLTKGRHSLHFGGVLPSLQQDIRYTLVVE